MKRSCMVCLEGIDASGKATQSKFLAEHLQGEVISFPVYETPSGQIIKSHLYEEWRCESRAGTRMCDETQLDALVFQSLMLTNKLEMVTAINSKRMERPIILDRYWPSAFAYGKADGLDEEWLISVHSRLPTPEVFILLDVDPSDSIKRRPQRRDRYERDHDRMHLIARNYRDLFTVMSLDRPGWHIVNARGTKEETQALLVSLLVGLGYP